MRVTTRHCDLDECNAIAQYSVSLVERESEDWEEYIMGDEFDACCLDHLAKLEVEALAEARKDWAEENK